MTYQMIYSLFAELDHARFLQHPRRCQRLRQKGAGRLVQVRHTSRKSEPEWILCAQEAAVNRVHHVHPSCVSLLSFGWMVVLSN
ncbi:hypothetical protein BD309DRAFT_973324 [Dichomitus squalens]|nr:hypothetical protein BD309DRAFT_973324 [Dichomitus squalens]